MYAQTWTSIKKWKLFSLGTARLFRVKSGLNSTKDAPEGEEAPHPSSRLCSSSALLLMRTWVFTWRTHANRVRLLDESLRGVWMLQSHCVPCVLMECGVPRCPNPLPSWSSWAASATEKMKKRPGFLCSSPGLQKHKPEEQFRLLCSFKP